MNEMRSPNVRWHVAPGYTTCVVVPGIAKTINCGSQERARLVAAAPEMLEALRMLIAWDDNSHNDGPTAYHNKTVAAAREAIAKAEGDL